jgi:hypothetical protein
MMQWGSLQKRLILLLSHFGEMKLCVIWKCIMMSFLNI